MPVTKGIGQSTATPLKQKHLRGILWTHFMVCKSIMAKYPRKVDQTYHWFDLTSGNGQDEDGNPGSALIFQQEAEKAGIKYHAVMVDIDPDNCRDLQSKFPLCENVEIRCGDYKQILPQYFGRSTSKWNLGFIYMDPNGRPDFGVLADASRIARFQKMDILVNCPATALKRGRKRIQLSDSLMDIKKRHWIIRNPYGAWQWSMLIGSNWIDFPAWEKKGFHRIESDMGQKILGVLTKTKKELKECQMRLWPTSPIPSI